MNKKRILIIGAGISGLTLARLFKDNGDYVEIREKESFTGGLSADYKHKDYYVSIFGPRFLRFSNKTKNAKTFLEKYTKLVKYNHKVIALGDSSFTFWPTNKTYLDLFNKTNPNKSMIDEFVSSYSKKVWDKDTKEVLGNIRSRFKFKDNYNTDFMEGIQGYIPKDGFTNLFKKMSKGIKIVHNCEDSIDTIYPLIDEFDYIFVSAPIDTFFKNMFGKLAYKKIQFDLERFENDGSNILLSQVMNLNTHPEIIRLTEYPQFYASNSKSRIIGAERRSEDGIPCYPVLTKKNTKIYNKYLEYSKHFDGVHFIGRLSEYKYKDFDVACADAILLFKQLKGGLKNGR